MKVLRVDRAANQGIGLGPDEIVDQAIIPRIAGLGLLEDLVQLRVREELVHRLLRVFQPLDGFLGVSQAAVGHGQEEPIVDQERVSPVAEFEGLLEPCDRLFISMRAVEQVPQEPDEQVFVLTVFDELPGIRDQGAVIVHAVLCQAADLEDGQEHVGIRGCSVELLKPSGGEAVLAGPAGTH